MTIYLLLPYPATASTLVQLERLYFKTYRNAMPARLSLFQGEVITAEVESGHEEFFIMNIENMDMIRCSRNLPGENDNWDE